MYSDQVFLLLSAAAVLLEMAAVFMRTSLCTR
jgi:hypothetical protein